MNEENERESEILEQALAVPEGERPSFLSKVCAGDAALLRRVERLLEAHHSAGDFLEAPAVANPADVPPAPKELGDVAGGRVGRYKLLQKIGEGGCGVVWMAEQTEPVRRQVALKIIKLGMDTREVIARFDAERQALAMLDHPNIAKILDAGATEAGRPFFVMELVRGIKITEFCDRGNLSTDQRLELFARVCHAVQHAHQKGIIHRDLKPSNILVTLNDGVAVPKVIDFGIAKATSGRLTDHTLFTAFEQFIGTPAYMSPEQAELSGIDIDTRSDIYSLGVLLYELLTGRLPFDPKSLLRAGIDEIRRIIREVEPPKPSTNLSTLGDADQAQVARVRSTDAQRLSLLLRGDLDWIVMRCLEKDRTRRYETPSALAADIGRHLRNEPVVARPPTRGYRFDRMVRRNRPMFAAIAAVAIALVAGFAISTWQAVRATRAERSADLERSKAVAERTRAEDLLKFMLGDLYTQLNGVGRLELLDAVADKATVYFASLDPGDLNDTTQFSRARALRLVGGVRTAQARYGEAESAFLDSYARSAALAQRRPRDGEVLFERSQAEVGLAILYWDRLEFGPAIEWSRRYRSTCVELTTLDPLRKDWQLELADAELNLGGLDIKIRDTKAAHSEFTGELRLLDNMASADSGNLEIRSRIADAHGWLGELAQGEGALGEALYHYTIQSTELSYIAEADPKAAERRYSQARALIDVVNMEMVEGNYAAARVSLSQAQNLLAALVASDEQNVDWQSRLLVVALDDAALIRRQGDVPKALRIVEGARQKLEAISANAPTNLTFTTQLLKAKEMEAQYQIGVAAKSPAHQAAELAEKLLQSEGSTAEEVGECARAFVIAGEIAANLGDRNAARSEWTRALGILSPNMYGTGDWHLLDPYVRANARLGRFADAKAAIAQLDHFGYVPIEPWPQPDPLDAANNQDQQQK